MPNKLRSESGFTLIEFLVVILIIGVLAVTALDVLTPKSTKARTDDTAQPSFSDELKRNGLDSVHPSRSGRTVVVRLNDRAYEHLHGEQLEALCPGGLDGAPGTISQNGYTSDLIVVCKDQPNAK